MSLKPGLNPKPSTNTKLKTTLKYVVAGGLLATAIFLTIYYSQEKDPYDRERQSVDLSDFKWEKVIVLDHQKVSGSDILFNFPILLHLQETVLKSKALGGLVEDIHGYDIVFVDELGGVMDHQIENYDPGSGELLVWLRMQELSPFIDTRFSLYFGNETIKEDLSTNYTWDRNYTGVWHLNNNTQDSTTINENTGSSLGTNRVLGKMAYGMQFRGNKNVDGSIVHIPDNNSLDLNEEGTIEAWVYVNSFQNWAGVIYKGDKPDFSDDAYFIQFLGNSERQRLTFGITGENGVYSYERSAIDLKIHTWYHVAFTWNPEKIQLYVNGYDYGSKVNDTAARNTDGGLNIGSQLNDAVKNNPFDGVIDEVRISKVARSQQWIATTYKNQSLPQSFFSIKDPQPRLGSVFPNSFSKNMLSSNTLKRNDLVDLGEHSKD